MAKKPTITVDLTKTKAFKHALTALNAAYCFIDKIDEYQDIDRAFSTDEYKDYEKTREKITNGN